MVYTATEPTKCNYTKRGSAATACPLLHHSDGSPRCFSFPNTLLFFHVRGVKLCMRLGRYKEMIASSETRLHLQDVRPSFVRASKREPLNNDMLRLFEFALVHVHSNTTLSRADTDGGDPLRSAVKPAYEAALGHLRGVQITLVDSPHYVSSLDIQQRFETEACEVTGEQHMLKYRRSEGRFKEGRVHRFGVTAVASAAGSTLESFEPARRIMAGLMADFERECDAEAAGLRLLPPWRIHMRYAFLTKSACLFAGETVRAPKRYTEWVHSAQDSLGGIVGIKLATHVAEGVVPVTMRVRPPLTAKLSHALQIRQAMAPLMEEPELVFDCVYPAQFGNVGSFCQYCSTDLRLAFGGLVGTASGVAARHAARSKAGLVLPFFNRTPALEAAATLRWAVATYGAGKVFAVGSLCEAPPPALHSFADVFGQCLRPVCNVVTTEQTFRDIVRNVVSLEKGAPKRLHNFTLGGSVYVEPSIRSAAEGNLCLVRGALSGGDDRDGREMYSGWTPLRVKTQREMYSSGKLERPTQQVPPENLYATFDPLWYTLSPGHGVNIGDPIPPHGACVKLRSPRVRCMHGADATAYIGPPIGAVCVELAESAEPTRVAAALYAAFGFADIVYATPSTIERLQLMFQSR